MSAILKLIISPLYFRYLGGWQFRHTFYLFLTLAASLVIPDLILINRWNLRVGVPDELLVFGEATVAPIIRRCIVMPMFIIAAKVLSDCSQTFRI